MNWKILDINNEISVGSYILIGQVSGTDLSLHIGLWYEPIISLEANLIKILCKEKYGLNYLNFSLDGNTKYSLIGNSTEIIEVFNTLH